MHRAPPTKRIDKKDSEEEERSLWPNERGEADNEASEKPGPNGAQKIRPCSNEIELKGRRCQKKENGERSEKCGEDFRERHGDVVCREGAKHREPKRCEGDSGTERFASTDGKARRDAGGQ
jgi:hypothetical protein